MRRRARRLSCAQACKSMSARCPSRAPALRCSILLAPEALAIDPALAGNPREEPGALAAHAGIRAGGGWQQPSLP